MAYSEEFLKVGIVGLLAVISPGPDFVLIARNSLVGSRTTGVFCAMGFGLGILVHVAYVLAGLGVLLAASPSLLTMIRYLGAAYLIYIGIQCLRASFAKKAEEDSPATDVPIVTSPLSALRMGLMTNVLNPKASLFMLSLFTQVIDPTTPLSIQIALGFEQAIITAGWFAMVALCLSHPVVANGIRGLQRQIDRVFGVALVGIGAVLFF